MKVKRNLTFFDKKGAIMTIYSTRKELASDYKLSMATVDRYLREMRSIKKYAGAIIRPSSRCTRINDEAFKSFLKERSTAW